MDRPLDGGRVFPDLALNLRVIHRASARRPVPRAVGVGDQVRDRVREGLAVIGNRDHDGHRGHPPSGGFATSDGTGSALIPPRSPGRATKSLRFAHDQIHTPL